MAAKATKMNGSVSNTADAEQVLRRGGNGRSGAGPEFADGRKPGRTGGPVKSQKTRKSESDDWALRLMLRTHEAASWPLAAIFLLNNSRIHPDYGMTWFKKFKLSYRMYSNWKKMKSASSFKSHLLMAAKLMELKPDAPGVVVECGAFKGASTANLSLACDIVGRDLIVYDSFEGLPAPVEGDQYAPKMAKGAFCGTLDEVKANVAEGGVLEVCEFRKGWFSDTLPDHTEEIALLFLDVDFQSSLDDCVRHLWRHLTMTGFLFTDDYIKLDKCALFFSEKYWRTHFNREPPGLMGAGTGVQLGEFFPGPFGASWTPLQLPRSTAYTRKHLKASWEFYPDEVVEGAEAAEGGEG